MEKNKITAVEWLIQEINPFLNMPIEDLYKTILQAKQMEEKQHSNTFLAGGRSAFNAAQGRDFKTFENYYNEIYGKE